MSAFADQPDRTWSTQDCRTGTTPVEHASGSPDRQAKKTADYTASPRFSDSARAAISRPGKYCDPGQTQPVGFGRPPYFVIGFIGPVFHILNITF